MREQPVGEAVDDDDFVPEGLMWLPAKEIDVSEVHQSLVKAVAGSRGVEFFTTYVLDAAMASQLGRVQLAIDHTEGEACGIFLTDRMADADPAKSDPIFVDEATEPFKFRYFDDVEEAVWAYSEHLKKAGIHPWMQP
ncbi:hypothetical protein J2J97_16025 [Rhizobium bangladeshense]|uniref:hypothetical protein n=1 Tax=Rhizobium bangladeshense TaxID=1138189 RepID=UPI001A984CC5|nr:hypothetical protein [Rhizobium bangladeshense]QSY93508.1 hypothetical protein J2J97_16025 [Rhizobium bangladeshense]